VPHRLIADVEFAGATVAGVPARALGRQSRSTA
jgi:hypothetical protein